MDFLLKNILSYEEGCFLRKSLFLENGHVCSLDKKGDFQTLDCENCIIIPGLVDVHVHLREPGFSFKETIFTGTRAAAHGGYTTVLTMPNLDPVPDNYENLKIQLDKIKSDAVINVIPFGSVTVGEKGEELSDMDRMKDHVAGFSDDGKGVQSREMMKKAMEKAKETGKIISAHCEDNSLLHGGYIHEGEYAKKHHHRGICSESEWKPIERDIELAKETGCAYHVCHVSAKESVELIRQAKKRGIDITCETAPHYLLLDDFGLQEDGRFKMNPPLRSPEDRKALIEGIKDGTVDIIATDHAPHTKEEKSKGLEKSLMGVTGLECAFSVLYTELVKKGIISLERLIELMSINPAKRFGIKRDKSDFTVIDLSKKYVVNPDDFLSMGKSTPFEGKEVYGEVIMTVCGGKTVYNNLGINTEVE